MENQNKQEVKNNSIVSEFVPYEESLELKKLGFDEPCFRVYDTLGFVQDEKVMDKLSLEKIQSPTFSQAFRWFREEYGLFTEFQCGDYQYYALIYNANKNKHLSEVWCSNEISLDTLELPYEEAELACLRKLIEIVKKK